MTAGFPETIDTYYQNMADRCRVLHILDTGLLSFFVLHSDEEVEQFYDRPCWSTPQDHDDGPIIYVDKLVSLHFNLALFRALEAAFTDRFPGWESIVWHRPGQDIDRRYTYRRRHGYQVHG